MIGDLLFICLNYALLYDSSYSYLLLLEYSQVNIKTQQDAWHSAGAR